jgi:hypothetical protein
MRRFGLISILFLIIGLYSVPSFAGSDALSTGNDYLQHCSGATEKINAGTANVLESGWALHCQGYISGFIDGMNVQATISHSDTVFCAVSGVTLAQATRVFEKYLKDNPQETHKPISVLLTASLKAGFPCK